MTNVNGLRTAAVAVDVAAAAMAFKELIRTLPLVVAELQVSEVSDDI